MEADHEHLPVGGGRTEVHRRGDVVLRAPGPWSMTVVELLHNLADVGYPSAPAVIGDGFDQLGRETISFIDGWTAHPHGWPDELLSLIGQSLRDLHDATSTFVPTAARWQDWYGRALGDGPRVIGHCDTGPWNILAAHDNQSVTLIVWETAGPVDPLIELAQACWLNAQLHDDYIAALQDLPPVADRARQVRLLVDGYRLPRAERLQLPDLIAQVAISDAADQARDITQDTTISDQLWAISWRSPSAAWILARRAALTAALS